MLLQATPFWYSFNSLPSFKPTWWLGMKWQHYRKNALRGIIEGKFFIADQAVGMGGGILYFVPEQYSCHGSVTMWEAWTCWGFGVCLSPAFQLILFLKKKVWNCWPPVSKQALHLLKIFVHTWQNSWFEICIGILLSNRCKECGFFIYNLSVSATT